MNSREHLADDLDRLVKRTKVVGLVAWAVAVAVMVYGTPIVFDFLVAHQVPGGIAWLLSLAADGALIVGLIATPVLAELEVPAGWVGTLRWVAGFITWALQTAGSWTKTGGPDMVGVAAHSAGPVLLFFAVEAASSFQRKVAAKLTEKARQLESAEQRDADARAERAEVDAKLRSTMAELTAARTEISTLTERLTVASDGVEAEKVNATLTVERLEAEIGELRTALTTQAESAEKTLTDSVKRLTAEREEGERVLKQKHVESLAKARAEKKTVNLTDYRNNHGTKGSPKSSPQPPNKPAMSDEEAVQAMFEEHSDPNYVWAQNAVRTLTGVGFNARMERLIAAWRERALREAGGDAAVNQ